MKTATAIFERSYAEVLAFIKHEDDKINRVLTALAFLTAAAAALFVFGASDNKADAPQFFFLHTTIHAPDFFFFAFLLSLVLALTSAIAALDPRSHYPHFLADVPGLSAEKTKTLDHKHGYVAERTAARSIIFYESIDRGRTNAAPRDPGSWWNQVWDQADLQPQGDPHLELLLAASYHDDALRLAHRAQHKTRRFAQCNAFVHAAVASLALLGISRLTAFSPLQRWVLMAIVLGVAAAVPVWDLLSLWLAKFPDLQRKLVWAGLFLAPSLAVTLGLLAAATTIRGEAEVAGYALTSPVIVRLASVSFETRRTWPMAIVSIWAILGIGLGIALGVHNLC